MSQVALLEYFTAESGTLIFLVKNGLDEPLVFEARDDDTGCVVTRDDLQRCVSRLLVDFHGLPAHWDEPPREGWYRQLLSLPPATTPFRRGSPISEDKLASPRYDYGLDYWQGLSSALLPVGLRPHLEDCDLLCVVPHGPLHALPVAALRWPGGGYLVERFGICHTPSAGVLRYCQAQNRSRITRGHHQPRRGLIVAVASGDDEDPSGFEADGEGLIALLNRQGEVTRLVGPERVTKEAIRRAVVSQEVVHLACHGFFAPDRNAGDALDAGLLVADGRSRPPLYHRERPGASFLLSAREVFGLDLSADLVTLRACSSGRTDLQRGDELMGLGRGFLYAGTPALIVSLWDVSIRSSRVLLDAFYRVWLDPIDPQPKWRALQLAQLSFLDHPDRPIDRHPYHWAPFILVGDWL